MVDIGDLITEKPITQRELHELTGYEKHEIRRAIQHLRRSGEKICSGNEGYWRWNGSDESWTRTKKRVLSTALNTLALYKAMEGLPIEGQVTADDVLRKLP